MRTLDSMLTSVPLTDWKAYLSFHTLNDAVSMAEQAVRRRGVPHAAGDDRREGAAAPLETLPDVYRRAIWARRVGKAYVARTFTPEAKARALAMVRNMEAVLRERLSSLSWMSDSTRKFALAKLDAFVNKIGYPDKWRDYSKLELSKRSRSWRTGRPCSTSRVKRDLAKVGKPTDRTEWGMTPATVNAQYNPLANDVTFPAAILQPPFFDPNADDAVNYGGMGAAIGHEMTHGFDDQGRQFDAQGNLRDWWTRVRLRRPSTQRALARAATVRQLCRT